MTALRLRVSPRDARVSQGCGGSQRARGQPRARGWAAAYTLNLLTRRKRLLIYSIQMLKRREPDWFRQDLTTLFDLLGRGELKPVIDRRLPLEQAALAQALVSKGETVGKIVLVCQ